MISKQHVVPIMHSLDIKYSGIISWEAFALALDTWLSDSLCFEGLSRGRAGIVLGPKERVILHYLIATYFHLAVNDSDNTILKLQNFLEASGYQSDLRLIGIDAGQQFDQVYNLNR